MQIQIVHTSKIQPNPNNPRLIKNVRFKKLVQSVKDLPSMLHLRPIIVDENYNILGGNMRYKACVEAGILEVPIIVASDLSQEEQQAFIIKDNVGYGDWDFDILANEYDTIDLAEWGVDIWQNLDDYASYDDIELNIEDTNNTTKKISIEFSIDEYDKVIAKLDALKDKYSCSDYRALLYALFENENV